MHNARNTGVWRTECSSRKYLLLFFSSQKVVSQQSGTSLMTVPPRSTTKQPVSRKRHRKQSARQKKTPPSPKRRPKQPASPMKNRKRPTTSTTRSPDSEIDLYLKNEKQYCLKKTTPKEKSQNDLCPCISPYLSMSSLLTVLDRQRWIHYIQHSLSLIRLIDQRVHICGTL